MASIGERHRRDEVAHTLITSRTEPVILIVARRFEVRRFWVMKISSLSVSQATSCIQLLVPGASVNSGFGMILASVSGVVSAGQAIP